MQYMPFIMLFIFGFIAHFPGKYRRTAYILSMAMLVNVSLIPLFQEMAKDHNTDLTFIYGAIDLIVATCMLKYGSKFKIAQTGILASAVFLNAVMLIDYGSHLIPYATYYYTIFGMNVLQILLVIGGLRGIFYRFYNRDGQKRERPLFSSDTLTRWYMGTKASVSNYQERMEKR